MSTAAVVDADPYPLLQDAVRAVRDRTYWSAFPESPSGKVWGERAAEEGRDAFEAHRGRCFDLRGDAAAGPAGGTVGDERSPYGLELGITYRTRDADALLRAAAAAAPAWAAATPEQRAVVCVRILQRLAARSFELAHAVMHTSGQPFVMAFQAGGPHALDRGLEAVAYAYAEQTRVPATVVWEKPQGKRPPLRLEKTFTVVPRGTGLVVGCVTFPTWNSFPGLFAGLATGNTVVVKPHPRAVLPLAISVEAARAVLVEEGFPADVVQLAPEGLDGRLAAELAVRPEVGTVDYTGGRDFGNWLEREARQALVLTEKAGVNSVVVDSTDDYAGMLGNLAFSLALYSGQMCTTPQNLLVPRDGIGTDQGRKSPDDLARDLGDALDRLLGEPAGAVEVLGAIASPETVERLERAAASGEVLVPSRAVEHPQWPQAQVRTPLVVGVDASEEKVYGAECFGPVTFLVRTSSTAESVAVLRRTATESGAITAAVHSTDEQVLRDARAAALAGRVALSENLTGGVYVNQSAAFSDFHATGGNPAATATYTDGAFVSGRFRVVQSRRPSPQPDHGGGGGTA